MFISPRNTLTDTRRIVCDQTSGPLKLTHETGHRSSHPAGVRRELLRTRGPSFTCLSARCLPCLKKCLFKAFPHFKLGPCFACCWAVGVLCVLEAKLLQGEVLRSPPCCRRSQAPFLSKAGHYCLVWMDPVVSICHPRVDTLVASVPRRLRTLAQCMWVCKYLLETLLQFFWRDTQKWNYWIIC